MISSTPKPLKGSSENTPKEGPLNFEKEILKMCSYEDFQKRAYIKIMKELCAYAKEHNLFPKGKAKKKKGNE
ncbi:MAG: hypothetical protein Q4F84_07390 [Fibrobacter sp.]|nr:hypothetical protein [Fibrobacter sp.]